jgi:hypothetical protein
VNFKLSRVRRKLRGMITPMVIRSQKSWDRRIDSVASGWFRAAAIVSETLGKRVY